MEKDKKTLILKHSLDNAIQFNGTANIGSVLGKVLAEWPEGKNDIKELRKEIEKTVKEVNALTPAKQKKEIEQFGELKKPEKAQREGLPELENAEIGKIKTRMGPEPSKYNHIGHALSFLINYLYAKKYKGKCILRYDDTNPLKEKTDYIKACEEDLIEYVGLKPDEIIFASDDIPKMYERAEELIKKGEAYVCSCSLEDSRKLRGLGKACACRKNTIKKNQELWKNMLDRKTKDGEFVLRLKIDMKHKNSAMRDPAIFRVITAPHFRQAEKICVWPLYDFESTLEDVWHGVTHIFRSDEFGEMRKELQTYIAGLFGYKMPVIIQYGRFQIEGMLTQGREIRKLIEEGKITGWDDPRLSTIRALKKRGIIPKTFVDIAESLGLRRGQPKINWDMIAAFNRKNIDSTSNRYFFVAQPIEITLDRLTDKKAEAPLLPGKREYRIIPVSKKIFVDKIDFVANRGKEVRLMHFCNIKLDEKAEVTGKTNKDIPRIHWVPFKNVKIKLVMPDNSAIEGLAEPEIKNVKIGGIVQFERIGFAKRDSEDTFYFAHK